MIHNKLIDLTINVKRATWRLNDDNHDKIVDEAFRANRLKAFERDDHTCHGCNFRSPPTKTGASWQEAHHVDSDHSNNDIKNLVTLCPLCHQVFHIGAAGALNGGTMIWLPEMTQADLNHLARSLFVALVTSSEYEGSARAMYASIESRAMYLEEVFSSGASDPSFFGQAYLDADPKLIQPIIKQGVRILPAPERFQTVIDHWVAMGYKGLPPETWGGLVAAEKQSLFNQ